MCVHENLWLWVDLRVLTRTAATDVWECEETHAGEDTVRMDQILKGAALLASPGANVIANDKASRRVC